MGLLDRFFRRRQKKQGASVELNMDDLVADLQDSDEEKSIAAAKALGEMGEQAVPPLIKALGVDRDRWFLRSKVKDSLVQIGTPAVKHLIPACKHQGTQAQDVLVRIGEPAVEPLIVALKSEDEDIVWHAARALGRIGDPRATQPLIRLLKAAPSHRIRSAAGLALGLLGDPHSIAVLIEELQFQNYGKEAGESLIKIGAVAVESLVAALRDKEDVYTSGTARIIRVLGEMEDLRAANALSARAVQGKDERLKTAALEALSKLKVPIEISEAEIVELRDRLLSNRYEVRKAALERALPLSSSITDSEFQRAFRASVKLQEAFDKQREAYSSTAPMKACHEAIRLQPEFSAAYACLSYLHREFAKKPNKALKWAQKAIEIDPQNEYAWTELGMVYVALRDVVSSTQAFHKAVTINPALANLEPYARLVPVYKKLDMRDHLDRAVIRLTQAGVGLDPAHEKDWLRMVMDTDSRKIRKAIQETQRA